MSHPFKPLSTEKLKDYFKKIVEGNCKGRETNQCLKKPSGRKAGNKLIRLGRNLKTWRQR
jgi:hypothetical protein